MVTSPEPYLVIPAERQRTFVLFSSERSCCSLVMHQESRHSDGPQPWFQLHREERCDARPGRCVRKEKYELPRFFRRSTLVIVSLPNEHPGSRRMGVSKRSI